MTADTENLVLEHLRAIRAAKLGCSEPTVRRALKRRQVEATV